MALFDEGTTIVPTPRRRMSRRTTVGVWALTVALFALLGAMDRSNPKRLGNAAFWGLLATLVAPIPVIGTAIVWVPLCLSLWFTGKGMAAVGLALWGIVVVSGVDNVLRPLF